MLDFEKLGLFYLGKPVDAATKQAQETPLLYQSKDLVTHAVCVGMTGSGKTGLCIGLLEEAAIDGIPAIAIDPKGDISNLLLTFPALRGEDFRPWIQEDEARTKGLSPDDFAAQQAETWKQGLAAFGEDGARIQRFKSAVDCRLYTPGSEAGTPLSILKSFAAPAKEILADSELLQDRVNATATSLLALVGIDADPLQSREHVLLANILDTNWRAARDLDLAGLIGQIQQPPFQKAGVMELETFFPAKYRFSLAMAFNNLLASPGFQTWLKGDPLDIGALLYTPAGKPKISIVSISHLIDRERMFFVSLLLNQLLAWVRAQPGTTSLRALFYMDEIFGYFPPVNNPPSKKPLLTLLKQARAFGVGIVLATQNPVDLDYKGLSNAGTWFIGRLQTERDKMRVLEGLEGAAGEANAKFDRGAMEQLLAGLGSRIFLMNNVHEDHPQLFQTRWTLSYLRGPLTRDQIRSFTQTAGPAPIAAPTPVTDSPVLPPDIPCYFIPTRKPGPVSYQPVLIGAGRVHFLDDDHHVDKVCNVVFTTPFVDGPLIVDWQRAQPAGFGMDELEKEAAPAAQFQALPAAALKAANYAQWSKAFVTWLFQTQHLDLFSSPSLGEASSPGESEKDFRVRLQQAAREERDRLADALKQKYAPQLAALADRKRRAELALEQQKAQKTESLLKTAVAVGGGLLTAFMGRKTLSVTNMNRAVTAARDASRSWKEAQDVGQASDNLAQIAQQSVDLQKQFDADVAAQQAKVDPATEKLDTVTIRPKKSNITVQLVALAWQRS